MEDQLQQKYDGFENEQKVKDWIEEALDFLNEDYTQHLYNRALNSNDVNHIGRLVKKAKGIWATMISDADQLLNNLPK